jgi:hypothetical protein
MQTKRHRVPVIFDYKFASGRTIDATRRTYRCIDAEKENARPEPGVGVIQVPRRGTARAISRPSHR